MWSAAQILPVAMPIHAERFITRDCVNQFDFIGFIIFLIMRNGIRTTPDFCPYGIAQINDIFHLFFNETKIFGCKRVFAIKIIIPAVFNDRPDCDFDVGPNFLHCACHYMGEIMADQLKRSFWIFERVDRDRAIACYWPLYVPMCPIDGCANRLFSERC